MSENFPALYMGEHIRGTILGQSQSQNFAKINFTKVFRLGSTLGTFGCEGKGYRESRVVVSSLHSSFGRVSLRRRGGTDGGHVSGAGLLTLPLHLTRDIRDDATALLPRAQVSQVESFAGTDDSASHFSRTELTDTVRRKLFASELSRLHCPSFTQARI